MGDNGKENGNYYNGLYMENMGGCQNYGPFLGTLSIRCSIVIGIQKGTIVLTTAICVSPYIEVSVSIGYCQAMCFSWRLGPSVEGMRSGIAAACLI